jgi:ABC-type antimicrobial peptide transport system permease subunit
VSNNYVSPGIFSALALPVVRGRDFTEADVLSGQKVAIVNETLATTAFGKGDPIGRRVAFGASETYDTVIVGVVRDLRTEHLREAAPDAIFFPIAQMPVADTLTPTPTGGRDSIDLTLIMRAGEATRFSNDQLLRHVLGFDPRLFVDRVWTFDEEAGNQLTLERLLALAGSVLGAIAIVLMVVGLYGTLAGAVVRGRRELGIRLALGATPGSVRGMIVVRSLVVALAGLAIGLPLSYFSTRSFAHMLYGVKPVEPTIVAAIVAIVLVTAALSAYLPARRAANVDPLTALRNE